MGFIEPESGLMRGVRIIAFLVFACSPLLAQDLRFRRVGLDEGLPQSYVNQIAQDAQGFPRSHIDALARQSERLH